MRRGAIVRLPSEENRGSARGLNKEENEKCIFVIAKQLLKYNKSPINGALESENPLLLAVIIHRRTCLTSGYLFLHSGRRPFQFFNKIARSVVETFANIDGIVNNQVCLLGREILWPDRSIFAVGIACPGKAHPVPGDLIGK